jgi:hypothetical protein
MLGLVTAVVGACAAPRNPVPQRPRSATEQFRLAAEDDEAAADHANAAAVAEHRPETFVCADGGMPSQTTSGGERLTMWSPCWSQERALSESHRSEALALRAEAERHRASARTLVDVERTFCAQLTPDELTHTPFFHREDIVMAVAYREGDRVLGAKVTFKAVPGLDANWMRMALGCHRARLATLGYPATYMSYDPTMLLHASVAVTELEHQVIVTIRADDDVDGAVAWSRAAALVGRPKPEAD